VYRARWISRNMTVALKRLTGRLEDGEVELSIFAKVYSVIPLPLLTFPVKASKLELLRHRNIIRFYGVVIQTPDYWMVTGIFALVHN